MQYSEYLKQRELEKQRVDDKDRFIKPHTNSHTVCVGELLPRYNSIPDVYKNDRNPYVKLTHTWFFSGLKGSELKVKDGINRSFALAHCSEILRSFEPSHEHKISAIAYLMSLWFDFT